MKINQGEKRYGKPGQVIDRSRSQMNDCRLPTVTDEFLMAQLKKRDADAFEQLYRRHVGILRCVIGRILNSDEEINDLLQEVFLQIWDRADNYLEAKGKALGWMITLARRRAIDRVRRNMAYFRAQERLRMESASDGIHHTDDEVNANDLGGVFSKLLSHLPLAQREAIHLSFYAGLSQREIADKTRIPLGTIKTRLELGLCKIRAAVMASRDFQEMRGSLNLS